VISSNGVRPYRGGTTPPAEVARALKVGSLVYGNISQAGNRLRVNVSLVSAATGAEIGSRVLERPREEIFALQEDLAKEVSIFLRKQMGEAVELGAQRAETRNPAAWELFQKAKEDVADADRLVATGDTGAIRRQFLRADSAFARVHELDPKWAAPVAMRGRLAFLQSRASGSLDKRYHDGLTQQGLVHAERAVQLNPRDADALHLRGELRYWRWLLNLSPDPAVAAKLLAEAEQDFRASVAANPNQANAWNSLSHLLMAKSQIAEGKLAALRAYEADPYLRDVNKTVWRLFQSSLDLQDGVEAEHWCVEGARRFRDDARFVECKIWLYALPDRKPNIDSAWIWLDQFVRLSPPQEREYQRLHGRMLVAFALARAGLADSAKSVAASARGSEALDPTRELVYLEAILHSMLGGKDEALRLLSIYVATNPQVREGAETDDSWWLRDLRSDPRYAQIVGRAQ
jgi:hypothetical protein